jgi:prophage regulatory protein
MQYSCGFAARQIAGLPGKSCRLTFLLPLLCASPSANGLKRKVMQTQAPSIHLAHTQKPVTPRDRLLRLPEVEALTGCRKSTVYKLMKEGKFPKSVRITDRMAAWPESSVLQWVQERIQQGGAK